MLEVEWVKVGVGGHTRIFSNAQTCIYAHNINPNLCIRNNNKRHSEIVSHNLG